MATNLRGEEGLLRELRDGAEHLRRVGEHVDDCVINARRLRIKRQVLKNSEARRVTSR